MTTLTSIIFVSLNNSMTVMVVQHHSLAFTFLTLLIENILCYHKLR